MSGLQTLRSQVVSLRNPARPKATRYGARVREQVVEVARAERRSGRALAGMAREIGLPVQTLSAWMRAKPRLRPVEVASEPTAATPGAGLVVWAGEVRIEGLDLAGVVRLVRALS
jgi:hypothetical protein